jgi:mRNA interferase MazF
MTRRSVICDRWDVVVVPFPFSDRAAEKRRPALVLSGSEFNDAGHTVLAMITTRSHHPWPGDCSLEDHDGAGLPLPCLVRLKLFTLDNRVILRRIGCLSDRDRRAAESSLASHLP